MKDDSRSLLIGFDGSPEAEVAIRAAGALLSPGRAVVAHVADIIAAFVSHTGPMTGAAEELEEEEARAAARIVERGADLAEQAGFETVAIVARGKPKAWPTLLELADEHGAEAVWWAHAGSAVLSRRSWGASPQACSASRTCPCWSSRRLPRTPRPARC